MNIRDEALYQYRLWLPGELRYSVKKAGYDTKIERAALSEDDPRSMYGFLAQEWHHHQLFKKESAHYVPFHGKSAQLQLAKVAAGLFDKVGLGGWMESGDEPSEANFAMAATKAANYIDQLKPWDLVDRIELPADADFEQTPFAPGIRFIMDGINRAAKASGLARKEIAAEFSAKAIVSGGQAVNCYLDYAETYLDANQLVLAPSQLA